MKKKTFTYVSLFSGIGGFEQALNKLGGNCVLASEIDKFANKAYEVLYGHETVGDITKVDAKDVPDHDLLVGGFPCQAFSIAGKRKGFEDTRGTLFFEIARIAEEKKPKALLLENVKGLVNHDKGRTLDIMIETLNTIGYTVDFKILNSKYFDVPQNRERIFIVAIREDLQVHEDWCEESTKGQTVVPRGKRRLMKYDWLKSFNFEFPNRVEVKTRLSDILETDVDEKYYLDEEKTAKLVSELCEKDKKINTVGHHPFSKKYEFNGYNSEISPTLIATDYKAPKTVLEESEPQMLGHIDIKGHDAIKRVYSPQGVSPTLTTMGGGHREPKIAERQTCIDDTQGFDGIRLYDGETPTIRSNRHGLKIAEVYELYPLTERRTEEAKEIRRKYRNEYGRDYSPRRSKKVVPRKDGISNCITATQTIEQKLLEWPTYRIRKLTPRECWRLQGFPDEAHDEVEAVGISDSQRYKQAGNAVTVNVIEAITERLISYI